jgi:hypothetical protein
MLELLSYANNLVETTLGLALAILDIIEELDLILYALFNEFSMISWLLCVLHE